MGGGGGGCDPKGMRVCGKQTKPSHHQPATKKNFTTALPSHDTGPHGTTAQKRKEFSALLSLQSLCGVAACRARCFLSFFLALTHRYTEKRIQRDEPARQVLPKGVVPYHAEPESALSSAQVLNLNNNSNNQSNAHVAINSTPKATSRAYVDPHRT